MVTTKLNLSMTEPQVRQIYAKQGDTGRVLDITLDQTPEDGTLRILRPDGTEVTSEAVTGGEVSESGETVTFESMTEADVTELKANIEPVQFSLPSGYQAIEYIQSTGHEYINTGFVPTSDDGFEIDFISNNDFSGSGNYGCILGARTSSMTLDFQLTTWSAGTNGTLRWGTGFQHGGGLLDKGTRQKAKLYQKTYTAPDGSTYSFASSYTGAYPLYVFSLNQAGSATQNASVILYSLKLYRSADLAMYLIPCKRTSDNKLGLYDAVGGTFLPVVNIDSSANPQGGGNVTLPNPTNPLPITGHDEVTVNFGAEQGAADETYTTSLGQTVYGGTLDLVSGVLTVDRVMVDMGSLSWSMSGSGNTAFFYANTASLGVASDITTSLNYICENYSIVAVSSGGTATGMAFTSASQLRIRDATYSDATSFKTAMNGVQLVYQLATPVEYQLTPQQIKTLVGTNNVWASSGDIVNITFTYGGLLSELPSEATEIVGKCYCDVEQNGVSSMPFTLNVKKNERES